MEAKLPVLMSISSVEITNLTASFSNSDVHSYVHLFSLPEFHEPNLGLLKYFGAFHFIFAVSELP